MSLLLTLGHIIEHIFIGKLEDMVYYSYFNELKTDLAEITSFFDYAASMACFISNLIEFVFFIIIISELIRLHLNRVRHRPNAARMHAKKNVVTATGHFVSWVIELLLFGAINMIVHSHKDMLDLRMWVFFMLFPSMNYAIFPIIQVFTSPDLRHHVFGQMSFTCPNSRFSFGGGSDQGPAGVEEIELDVIANGDVAHHV